MLSRIRIAVGFLTALALLDFGAAPALAGGYGWRAYSPWESNWRAAYLAGDWDGVIRTGSPDPRIARAVLGKYPYHDYGYNNGACIGYEWVCDPWGNVIGRVPVLVC